MKRLLAVLTAISLVFSCAPSVEAGNTKETAGYIALTFDDGPSGAITETLLDGLAARNVKATFFLCGYRIEKFPEIAQRMAEEGHELGLHSNRHDYMQHMTKEEALDDLSECQSILVETTGVSARLFRPPGGLYSQALLAASRELGLSIVFWSVDPHDWDKEKSAQVLPYLLSHASAGGYHPDARPYGAFRLRRAVVYRYDVCKRVRVLYRFRACRAFRRDTFSRNVL